RMQLLEERCIAGRELHVLGDPGEVERALLGEGVGLGQERGELEPARQEATRQPVGTRRALAETCAGAEERNHVPFPKPSRNNLAVPTKGIDGAHPTTRLGTPSLRDKCCSCLGARVCLITSWGERRRSP